jgi:hypothetical protein
MKVDIESLTARWPRIKLPSTAVTEHSAAYIRNSINAIESALSEISSEPDYERIPTERMLRSVKAKWESIPETLIRDPENLVFLNFKSHNDSYSAHPCSNASLVGLNSIQLNDELNNLNTLESNIENARSAWLNQRASETYLNQKVPIYEKWLNDINARKYKIQRMLN